MELESKFPRKISLQFLSAVHDAFHAWSKINEHNCNYFLVNTEYKPQSYKRERVLIRMLMSSSFSFNSTIIPIHGSTWGEKLTKFLAGKYNITQNK